MSPFRWWEYLVYWLIFFFFTIPLIVVGFLLRALHKRNWGAPPSPGDVKKLLIVQIENLGDFLISAGFSRAVREAYPNAEITIVVDSKFDAVVSRFPYFDHVIGFNQSGGRAYRLFAGPIRAFRVARERFWSENFDLVLNQRWDVDSKHGTVLGMFALGRYHLGFSSQTNPRRKLINIGLDWMFTRAIKPAGVIHDGLRGGQLLEDLGLSGGGLYCEIYTTTEERQYAKENLKMLGSAPLVTLGIGANVARRQWPIEWYGQLATWVLTELPDAYFLVVGHAGDGRDAEVLRPILQDRLLNFGGKCTLTQSAALLRRANFYFGTESGPMHMSSAQDVPLVTFFAFPPDGPPDHPNSPVRYAPIGTRRAIILQPPGYTPPCNYGCKASKPHCVMGVTVEMAKAAISEMISDMTREKALTGA